MRDKVIKYKDAKIHFNNDPVPINREDCGLFLVNDTFELSCQDDVHARRKLEHIRIKNNTIKLNNHRIVLTDKDVSRILRVQKNRSKKKSSAKKLSVKRRSYKKSSAKKRSVKRRSYKKKSSAKKRS